MRPQEILTFWLEEMGPEKWYAGGEAIDAEIKRRFGAATENARNGDYDDWAETAEGALALLILLDQFPRNIYRGQALAFAADAKARDLSRSAIERDLDMQIEGGERQFFYLPLEHSEELADQDLCVKCFDERMPPPAPGTPPEFSSRVHARAHRDVIRFFGRFPYRNKALGRENTPAETTYLELGAYRLSVALRTSLAGMCEAD